MNKIISVVGAAALVGVVSLSAIAPAAAAPWGYGHGYYGHGYYGRGGWYGPGPAIGAGILGFAAGAAIAGAASQNNGYGWRNHVAACEDTYRSYDVRSDTYVGFDGLRHRCQL